MEIIRAIEIYDRISEENISTIYLEITSHGILELLSDLKLNYNDYPDELYDPYILSESQVKILLHYVGTEEVVVDTNNFIYELNCYSKFKK